MRKGIRRKWWSGGHISFFRPVRLTFSFCNALHRVLARGETGMELVRGLFHGAMSIYVDRFLNVPGAKLPSEQPLENLPTAADKLRETILFCSRPAKGVV